MNDTPSQPPEDLEDDGFYGHEPERAPWGRYVVATLALLIVGGGAIWLASKVVIPKDIPVEETIADGEETVEVAETDEPDKPLTDDEAWVRALEKDTLEGYREYLEAFPNGKHVEEAQEEINKYDERDWQDTLRRDTIAAYEDYLEKWPEGLHADKAREIIAERKAAAEARAKDAAERAAQEAGDWETAARENTVESYERYLAKHPAGAHADEARSRIASLQASAADEAAWQQAKAANRASSYEQYLSSFPQGAHVAEAIAALEQLKPAPGRTFKDCDVCPTMVSLPSGNANLGAANDDGESRPNERPQRPVTFNTLFSIAVTEVTFAEWDACVADGGCETVSDNGWGRGRRPVINVSWDAARGYAEWLSATTGFSYTLPSEAQWEYAARGGDTGVWGGSSPAALCAFANGAGAESGLKWANSACTDPASDRTLPAGSLIANGFGVKDMIGNVAEWTLDCNTLNLRDAPTDGGADLRGSCNQRAVRGGSWFSGPNDLRFAARLMQRRGDNNDFTGFRVVRKVVN